MKKKNTAILKMAIILATIPASQLWAVTRGWDGGAGNSDWFSNNNWNPDGAPGNNDILSITSISALTVNASNTVYCYSGGEIKLSGSGLTVNMNGGSNYGLYSGSSATEAAKLTLASYATLNSKNAYMGGSGLSDISLHSSTWNINSTNTSMFGMNGSCNLYMAYSNIALTNSLLYAGYSKDSVFTGTISGSSTLQSNNHIHLGYSGKSYLSLDYSGDLNTSSNLYLGTQTDSYSEVTLDSSGSSVTATGALYCGYGGYGIINTTDGADIVAGNLYIGYNGGSEGIINLRDSGTTLTVNYNAMCGGIADGTINVSNGASINVLGTLTVSDYGTINQTEASVVCNSLIGQGRYNFNSGYLTVSNSVTLGDNSPLGDYIDWNSNHSLTTYGTLSLTPGLTAHFDESAVQAGSIDNQANIYIKTGGTVTTTGTNTNNGLVNMSGGIFGGYTLINDNGGNIVGSGLLNSTNSTMVNKGTISNSGYLSVNNSLNNSGQINVTSYNGGSQRIYGTLTNDGTINMYSSLACSTIDNNSMGIISGYGTISGTLANYGGLIYANGGTLTIRNFNGNNNDGGELRIANDATMRIVPSMTNNAAINLLGSNASLVTGGIITNNGSITGSGRISGTLDNSGQVYANSGTLTVTEMKNLYNGNIEIEKSAIVNVTNGISNNNGTINLYGGRFNNNNHGLTNNGYILGNGTVSASYLQNLGYVGIGDGDMKIIANNFYQYGTVNVQEDSTLTFYGNVSGPGSFTGTGSVVFLADYSPGASPASVSIQGDVSLQGSLLMELAGTTMGSEYDHLTIDGLWDIGGILEISLLDGFVPAYGDSFDLFDFNEYTGSFTSIIEPELPGNLSFDYSELYTTGTVTVVPEPATLTLLGAAAALVARRRK